MICGADCQAAVPTTTVDPVTGYLLVRDPTTGNASALSPADVPGFVGALACDANATSTSGPSSGCRLHTLLLDGSGFQGVYGLGPAVEAAVAAAGNRTADSSRRRLQLSQLSPRAGRRHAWLSRAGPQLPGPPLDVTALRQAWQAQRARSSHGYGGRRASTTNATGDSPVVSRPIVCLELGQGLLFDLPAGRASHPVYVKDSLLNTNDAFDYGEQLAALAASATGQVSVLARCVTSALAVFVW